MIGANIYDIVNKIGTTSNEYGFYSLTIPSPDTIRINVSFIGYLTKKIVLNDSSGNKVNILLSSGINLNEVVVETKQESKIRNTEAQG